MAQQQLPSVTAILSLTKSEEDKAALSAWKKRVGEKEAQNIVSSAAANGTKMHSIIRILFKRVEKI